MQGKQRYEKALDQWTNHCTRNEENNTVLEKAITGEFVKTQIYSPKSPKSVSRKKTARSFMTQGIPRK
jgi:hypothetical protein